MTPSHGALLFGAAIIGGAMNSVAGGGSFVVFPALVFTGVPVIPANATNTVALWPGSIAGAGAYRRELSARKHEMISLGSVSLIGGLAGAILLLHTSPTLFQSLLPWLLLGATLLFAFGGQITRLVKSRRSSNDETGVLNLSSICVVQFVIAIYGGFFGGGIGILMLAGFALMGMRDINTMNALKSVLACLINGVAVLTFVAAGKVYWLQAGLMMIGAIIGGYGGASVARKLPQPIVRAYVIAVGLAMTVWFFLK